MIAEIYSKISSSGSNISERLEDQLTGNVFGNLRYLPLEIGLKNVLRKASFENAKKDSDFQTVVDQLPNGPWNQYCCFWPPHKKGEIDLLLPFPKCVIGIEVKLHSGLSSDDGLDNSQEDDLELRTSLNQLARETKIVHSHCSPEAKSGWLILLAKHGEAGPIVESARQRDILGGEIPVGVLSWTSVLEALQEAISEGTDSYQKLILEDIVRLLRKKGFERFCDFSISELRVVNADSYFDFPKSTVSFSFDTTLKVNPYEYFRITG